MASEGDTLAALASRRVVAREQEFPARRQTRDEALDQQQAEQLLDVPDGAREEAVQTRAPLGHRFADDASEVGEGGPAQAQQRPPDEGGEVASRARLEGRRKVLFLDTCYSGRAVEGSRDIRLPGLSQTAAAQDLSGDGFVVITSSDASEQSHESKKIGNGYFTSVLVEALRAEKGRLTSRAIYARLRDEVPKHVERDVRRRQNPKMFDDGSNTAGEILIGAQSDQ
jgi:hypothetical protein